MNINSISKQQIELGSIYIDVIYKDIKNLHLSVHPPTGQVRISAPLRMNVENIRIFAISKIGWIKKQQTKFLNQKRETSREYITRESHYYLGKRYLLKVIEQDNPPKVVLQHDTIELYVRKGSTIEQKQIIMDRWYRKQLKKIVPGYIAELEKKINVQVVEYGIKIMKTKWGSCNPDARRIWLNLELAKKPLEYLEYILAHEMIHLIERQHNKQFIAYLNKFIPKWRHYKEELNRSALGFIDW
ncbi:MAG: M48 family metallopeptidase [Actinobacteria bacterium]|nr:M48 family metallopeptidase [Actinomycetota bacterium]